jgi:sigma-B regulation protein RsbU (phosphoserine phosphatase)
MTTLPKSVLRMFSQFEEAFGVSLRLLVPPTTAGGATEVLFASGGPAARSYDVLRQVELSEGGHLELQVAAKDGEVAHAVAHVLAPAVERALESDREVRFFTLELTERYEEIDLLYSISETLGAHLEDASRMILRQVCDVMGARRGSLWVYDEEGNQLLVAASVGSGDKDDAELDPDAVTSMVFQEQRAIIGSRTPTREERDRGLVGDSFLAVPIRYTPPDGDARTVGVVNLVGRRNGERFSSSDQKLLSAIASQVGAALENKRLVREGLSKERMAREMELAQDLQQKLLPDAARFLGAEAAARVQPAAQVGGDFYQLFRLPRGRIGVMLGDVSLHGFPSALIMTLTMSAAGIYAREHDSPAAVLRDLDDALREELETTEMFLTVFYGVIDVENGTLRYSNAGHPHAFAVHGDGGFDRLTATDPPVGFAGPDSYGEHEVQWSAEDDLLLLFTDGLSDILSSVTRGDGEERVLDTVVANRRRPASLIVDELFALTADAEPPVLGDDRTALVVRV